MATKKVKTTKVTKKVPVKKAKIVKKPESQVVAVIQIDHRQFLVKVGDVVTVNNLSLKDKELITPNVLLTFNGEKTEIGQPLVVGAKVTLEHIETKKGLKIRVSRFKAKSRYRKVKGSRQLETHLTVKSIKI